MPIRTAISRAQSFAGPRRQSVPSLRLAIASPPSARALSVRIRRGKPPLAGAIRPQLASHRQELETAMPTPIEFTHAPTPAIVARPAIFADETDTYLQLDPAGRPNWTRDPADATPFASMREAARAAFRLPSGLRAFGLPRSVELALAH
jgi:hypothetical protein